MANFGEVVFLSTHSVLYCVSPHLPGQYTGKEISKLKQSIHITESSLPLLFVSPQEKAPAKSPLPFGGTYYLSAVAQYLLEKLSKNKQQTHFSLIFLIKEKNHRETQK